MYLNIDDGCPGYIPHSLRSFAPRLKIFRENDPEVTRRIAQGRLNWQRGKKGKKGEKNKTRSHIRRMALKRTAEKLPYVPFELSTLRCVFREGQETHGFDSSAERTRLRLKSQKHSAKVRRRCVTAVAIATAITITFTITITQGSALGKWSFDGIAQLIPRDTYFGPNFDQHTHLIGRV